MKDLTVLDNDPYRLDTPANHRDGKWFAGQIARFVTARIPPSISEGCII